jgi:hypothetical protein
VDDADRFEELLRVNASEEEVWRCGVCGKDRLYRNVHSGNWFCHPCGEGGHCDGPAESMSRVKVLPVRTPQPPVWCLATSQSLFLRLGTMTRNQLLALSRSGVGRTIHSPVTLSLFGLDGLVGNHLWNPNSMPRYSTVGARGVCLGTELFPRPRVLVLFEGVFDYLSWFLCFPDGVPHCIPAFTAGSTLTGEQVVYLRSLKARRVIIAFDNDKTEPIVQACNAVRSWPYTELSLSLPPAHLGKDWWDVWAADPDLYRKLWRGLL